MITAGLGIISTSIIVFVGIKNIINWKTFKSINQLISTKYDNSCIIFLVSLYFTLKTSLTILLHNTKHYDNSYIQQKGKQYIIKYKLKGKVYKLVVKPSRGPKKILQILDKDGVSVLDNIAPYLGPENNFHGKQFTPVFFGFDKLIFELSDGKRKIFEKNEKIIF